MALPADEYPDCIDHLCARRRRGSARPVSLTKFLFPREIYLHRSAIVDYKFVAIDLTIKLVVYTPLIAGFSMLVYQAAAAPFAGLAALDLPLKGVLVGTIAIPILAIVVADFGFFLSHSRCIRSPCCGTSMKSITQRKCLRR